MIFSTSALSVPSACAGIERVNAATPIDKAAKVVRVNLRIEYLLLSCLCVGMSVKGSRHDNHFFGLYLIMSSARNQPGEPVLNARCTRAANILSEYYFTVGARDRLEGSGLEWDAPHDV